MEDGVPVEEFWEAEGTGTDTESVDLLCDGTGAQATRAAFVAMTTSRQVTVPFIMLMDSSPLMENSPSLIVARL